MPRSGVPFQRSPCAATYTRSGFDGCTRTAEICRVASSPTCVHVVPASVLLVHAVAVGRRLPANRVLARADVHHVRVRLGATAIAPMELVRKNASEMLRHDAPAFSVFHTPPPV